MRASSKFFIIVLGLSMIATGCANTSENIINTNNDILKKDPIEENIKAPKEEALKKIRQKIVDPFLEKLPANATAEDIGLYIRENIANASEDEADKMIEWLIIYQDKTKDEFTYMKEGDVHARVLEDDMEGVWDKSKIDNIQDDIVRNDYNILINSFMKVENYYDYLNIETNWDDLMEYSSYLSDNFRKVIELKKKVNNYEYDRYELDVTGLSKDIITVEEIIENSKSTFIKWKAYDLYRFLTYDLLAGPENSYIYHYQDKNTKEYESLMQIRSMYPESILKEIIDEIDSMQVEDIMDVIGIINKRLQFGLDSDNYLEVNNTGYKNGEYNYIEIHIPSDIEKQNRINDIIKLNTEEYIENTAKDKIFSLEIELDFQNKRYISYHGYIEITDSKGEDEHLYLYRNLDYMEEEYITLEDYFDADFSFIQEYIERVSQVKIESLPGFGLTEYGMFLDLEEEYIYLKHKDLLEYFTLEEIVGRN